MKTQQFLLVLPLAFLLVFALVAPAIAWQIVSTEEVPQGMTAITPVNGGVLCGFDGEEDQGMIIINPETGHAVNDFETPEAGCFGLGSEGNNWFLGSEALYALNPNGEVINQLEKPYEFMRGLVSVERSLWTMIEVNDAHYLTLFTPGGNELRRFHTNIRNPGDLAFDGEYLWITDRIEGFLHVFDPNNGNEVNIFRTPTSSPRGIASVVVDNTSLIVLVDDGRNADFDVMYMINPSGGNAPKLLPISRQFDFSEVLVFGETDVNLSMFNVGNSDLVIEEVRFLDGNNGFEVGLLPREMVIDPGDYLNIPVEFAPTAFRQYIDVLRIVSNDPVEPEADIVVTGLGIFNSRRLGFAPDPLDFGVVRGDPWRDGSRTARLAIFNMGLNELRVDSVAVGIPDIFQCFPPEFPQTLETTDTIWVDLWFTPNRGINYIDTLLIYSNDAHRIIRAPIRGTGSDSVFATGSVMWEHQLEDGNGSDGCIMRQSDVNNDLVDDCIAIGPAGTIYCLNGFGSGVVDPLWIQAFEGQAFAPTGVLSKDVLVSAGDINGDGGSDIFIGSGREDRAVYGINGFNGELIWRWDARSVQVEGPIRSVVSGYDSNGDGASDPVVLIFPDNDGPRKILRLDGATGRPIWTLNAGTVGDIEPLDDFNLDGVVDFVMVNLENQINLVSGVDGGLIISIETESVPPLFPAPDLDGDGKRDLIINTGQEEISAWSLLQGEHLWTTGAFSRFELGGNLMFLEDIGSDFDGDGVNEMAGCGMVQVTMCINPVTGETWWADPGNGTSIAILPDNLNGDGVQEVILGGIQGNLVCFDGRDGAVRWNANLDDVGAVIDVISFEDVDLGLSVDVVGIFEDGYVRCISTGGDLSVGQPTYGASPGTSDLIGLFPNPFNSTVNVSFTLERPNTVTLSVMNINGQIMSTRDLGFLQSGVHSISYNPLNDGSIPNGTYFFRIEGSSYDGPIGRGVLLK